MKQRVKLLTLGIFLIGLCAVNVPATAADVSNQTAHNEGDVEANARDLVQGSHVEGHVAFLHAELGITPAQEPLWAPVAASMRDDVRNLQDADRKAMQQRGPHDAMEYLENRAAFAELRAQGEQRFLDAFRPLYNALSNQQKKIASEILIPDEPE